MGGRVGWGSRSEEVAHVGRDEFRFIVSHHVIIQRERPGSRQIVGEVLFLGELVLG